MLVHYTKVLQFSKYDFHYELVSNKMLSNTVPVSQSDSDYTAKLMIKEGAETACYIGAMLSALMAYRINRMPDKTFINKMFFWYFTVDAIMGTLITFLLFRVQGFV